MVACVSVEVIVEYESLNFDGLRTQASVFQTPDATRWDRRHPEASLREASEITVERFSGCKSVSGRQLWILLNALAEDLAGVLMLEKSLYLHSPDYVTFA